jgi:hypothetical protein
VTGAGYQPPQPLPFYLRAILSLSEGMCPEHGSTLRASGWCPACHLWWSANFREQTVTATYPFPECGVYPEP